MNKKNNKKGIALVQILLAVAIGSALSVSVFSYYRHTSNTEKATKNTADILEATAKSPTKIYMGKVDDCEVMRAKLAESGGVASCVGEVLTYKSQDYSPTFGQVRQVALNVGTPDNTPTTAPTNVALSGAVSLASVEAKATVGMGSPSGAFSSTQERSGSIVPIGGGNGGSVSSSPPPWTFSNEPVRPAVGTATVPPAYPVPSAPSVLSSMWGVNVVVSQGSGVDHYEMGITCGISPPASRFASTVQTVPASGLTQSVNTSNLPGLTTGYYFVPVGVPYTVIGGMSSTAGSTEVVDMTKALPQSACNMGGGYGGVWAVQVKVKACNANGQCSAWSPDFGQFCGFNRC